MHEPKTIPAIGAKLRVVHLNTDEIYLRAILVPDYRKAMRRSGEIVEMAGYIAGHGGDIWWCRHENGDVAPYGYEELDYEPIMTGERTPPSSSCCMNGLNANEPCWGNVEVSDYGPDDETGDYPIYTCEGHREHTYVPNKQVAS